MLFSKVYWIILALPFVCFLPECDITADDFNLGSYDLWSKEIQLSWKEKPAIKKLIGKSPQLYRDCLNYLKICWPWQLCSDTRRCIAK